MRLSDFDYHLPPSLIAQYPAERREASRLLVLGREDGSVTHAFFYDLVDYLKAGDALVMNDTRVTPSRLHGRRADTGGKVELLLISEIGEGKWESLVRPHKRGLMGADIRFGDGDLTGRVLELKEGGRGIVLLECESPLKDMLLLHGRTPLPPYIKRDYEGDSLETEMLDRERYQTVIARREGAVAAPTAGLHFSEELLGELSSRDVRIVTLTLHVGPGTFMPVRTEDVQAHRMEAEYFSLSKESAEILNEVRASGGRLVCVGSTATRVIETCSTAEGRVRPAEGWTDLFIYPGYEFKAVDALITNFHLPKSTLLMLVCAYAGRGNTLAAYREAVERGYRFYSYGDAMLII
jgi:S-adenosylmethionine:tRNA ribosyltransferase-isomerase